MIFHQNQTAKAKGFTLLEVCVATTLSILLAAAIIGSLVQCMRFAAAARLLTNARAIIHRNINAASGVGFTDTLNPPSILAITSGKVCEDDGVTTAGTTLENIQLGTNGSATVTGTLSQVVSPETINEANATTAVVYRVTFTLSYIFASKPYSYSETTLRAKDDNN